MSNLSDHIVIGYDTDMNALNAKLSEMGSMTEKMLSDVIK
jgi:hypothetical protein